MKYGLETVKSACCGFARIVLYGGVARGPTHFGCGPGFPKRGLGNSGARRNPLPGPGKKNPEFNSERGLSLFQ
jgi:hypothetical protein